MTWNVLGALYFAAFGFSGWASFRFYAALQETDPDLWRRLGCPTLEPDLDPRPYLRELRAVWRNEHRTSTSRRVRRWGEAMKWSHPVWIIMLSAFTLYLVVGLIIMELGLGR